MLIAENDQPTPKGEYPIDIQGREHAVMGWYKSQGERFLNPAPDSRDGKKLPYFIVNDLFARLKKCF